MTCRIRSCGVRDRSSIYRSSPASASTALSTKNQLLRTAQQNLTRQLELEEAEINRERDAAIRQAENESKMHIKVIEDRVWLWAVLIPPIPAIIVGLTMLSLRITNERSNIDPKRHV